jgi:hypothetical protein
MNTTEQKNRLIAEFMGYSLDDENLNSYSILKNGIFNYIRLDNLKYNSDWNDLMEVVEKIESLGYSFRVEGSTVIVKHTDSEFKEMFGYSETYSKIEAVYNAVVEFIEWYNSAKEN